MLSSEREKKSEFLLENVFYGEDSHRDLRHQEQRCTGEIVCHYLEHQHKGRSLARGRGHEQEWSGGESPWPLTPVRARAPYLPILPLPEKLM